MSAFAEGSFISFCRYTGGHAGLLFAIQPLRNPRLIDDHTARPVSALSTSLELGLIFNMQILIEKDNIEYQIDTMNWGLGHLSNMPRVFMIKLKFYSVI